MDPIVLAAASALVGAMATDSWDEVKHAVAKLWHRIHPGHTDEVSSELELLRRQVLEARANDDQDTERALEGFWQLKLQELLRADAALKTDLRQILDQVLTPALPEAAQTRIGTILMTGTSQDSSTFTQIGTQVNYGQS